MKSLILLVIVITTYAGMQPSSAFAEIDIRTPWADVYVGPEGVYVHGPWGRVEVPASERHRVCRNWHESVLKFYKDRRCQVEFDDKGCTIRNVECEY